MASAQVVETSVTNNSPSQDSYHPDDLFQSRYATPGFKPFSYLRSLGTLKMASAQVVETSVTNNSPSQDSYHPDDLFQSR